jgi:Ser/Thr protein kinase RdoA (MazF antagonist)
MNTGGFENGELARVLDQYDLGAVTECVPLRRGDVRVAKLIIRSEKGRFIIKKRPLGHDDPYQIALAHDIQLYLTRQGFLLPRLIGTRYSNSTMHRTDTAIYEILNYVEGEPYDGSRLATISAGRWLCRFHEFLADYRPAYEVPRLNFHNNTGLRKDIQRLPAFTNGSHISAQERDALSRIMGTLLTAYNEAAQEAKEAGHDAAAPVICHGDWHPGNMIFREGQVIAVLDYGSVRLMPALNDAAIGCLQFSLVAGRKKPGDWPDHFDMDRIGWFLSGYQPAPFWSDKTLGLIRSLMIEALIAEAVTPVAATGQFANHHGGDFLEMINRKVNWLRSQPPGAITPR